ncbi:LOW QUALITY PROTEIN: hypothetical protein ACHAW6_010988 [Cyclotella cf. meneghiniana]
MVGTSTHHQNIIDFHIKSTKAECLTDTIQFKHKSIANPTLSHADKLMNALANCKAALTNKWNNTSNHSLAEL